MKTPTSLLNRTPGRALLATAIIAVSSFSASAKTYVSTMRPAIDGEYGEVFYAGWPGFAFTTDDETYQITSVVARMQIPSSGAIGSFDLKPVLFQANSSGLPLSNIAIGTFSHASLSPSSVVDITFNANGSIVLEANSTYLFALTPTDTLRDVLWYFTNATGGGSGVPGSDWGAIDDVFYSDNFNSLPWAADGDGAIVFMAEINADVIIEPIPEPSTWVAIISGASLLAFGHLRRRRKASEAQG